MQATVPLPASVGIATPQTAIMALMAVWRLYSDNSIGAHIKDLIN
jgi:hypothetical protein